MTFIRDFFHLGISNLLTRILISVRVFFIVVSFSPAKLADYTLFSLFIFYCGMLDCRVMLGLERDLPHYRAKNNLREFKDISDLGWSTYFSLGVVSSIAVFLAILLTRCGNASLALILGIYLFTDKVYRALEIHARISLRYKEAGLGAFATEAVNLLAVLWLLPKMGIQGIFIAYAIGFLVGSLYLLLATNFDLNWKFQWEKSVRYIWDTAPLAIVYCAMESFHTIPLAVLAFRWDRENMGYFVFAFRIFQIFLNLFPYLFQQIMRVRIHHLTSIGGATDSHLKFLSAPVVFYFIVTGLFYLCSYWWMPAVSLHFFPAYEKAIASLQVLPIALFALGIAKIGTDFLSSRTHGQMWSAAIAWVSGILLQVAILFLIPVDWPGIAWKASVVYIISAVFVYILIWSFAFEKSTLKSMANWMAIGFVFPFIIIHLVLKVADRYLSFAPSNNLSCSLIGFCISSLLFLLVTVVLYLSSKNNRKIKAWLKFGTQPLNTSEPVGLSA